MLIAIVLIYFVAEYLRVLYPERAKEVAAVALVLTLLVALGMLMWPAIPLAGRR